MGTGAAAAVPGIELGRSVRLSRLSDELLARHAARGSSRAFAVVYERYRRQLYRYCRSITRDDADAQDALQSTFAAALSALRRGRRNAPLRPWLFRIAHNEAISLLRQRRRQDEHRLSAAPPPAPSTEERVAERARWAALMSDLGELPVRQRSALLLRELNGLSHDEIAIALDTSVGGAKQAIFEARQALLDFEQGRAMSCDAVRARLSEGDRRVLRGRRVRGHLRACSGCAAFASAIPERRAQLRAFTPGLPSTAAAALLSRALHTTSLHGGAPATGAGAAGTAAAGTAAAGTATVGTTAVGAALASKLLLGAALVVTAAGGAAGLSKVLGRHHAAAGLPPAQIRHSGSTGSRAAERPPVARAGAQAHHSSVLLGAPAGGAKASHGRSGVTVAERGGAATRSGTQGASPTAVAGAGGVSSGSANAGTQNQTAGPPAVPGGSSAGSAHGGGHGPPAGAGGGPDGSSAGGGNQGPAAQGAPPASASVGSTDNPAGALHGNPAHGNPAQGNPAQGNPAHGNPAAGNPAASIHANH
jgi:RNA polymerase sigma factor (sigma-70 family)